MIGGFLVIVFITFMDGSCSTYAGTCEKPNYERVTSFDECMVRGDELEKSLRDKYANQVDPKPSMTVKFCKAKEEFNVY